MLRPSPFLQNKALVCVKRVIDYAVKVRVAKDKSGVEIKNVKMSIMTCSNVTISNGSIESGFCIA